jgi:hypothetical protein
MVMTGAPSTEAVSLPRALEVLAILLLASGTLCSAWSIYQAYRWNKIQADQTAAATAARIASGKEATIATATIVYDASLLAQTAAAIAEGQTDLQRFYRTTLARPAFLALVDEAVAQAGGDPTALPNLFASPRYLAELQDAPQRLDAAAAEFTAASTRAGGHADAYTLVTVLLAIALFFGGAASNFRWLPLRGVMLAIALVMLLVGAARLAALPFA